MEKLEILSVCRNELFSAVLADTLDAMNFRNQVVAPGLNPLNDDMQIVGYARTGIYMPIYHDDENVNVYENEIRLIDDLEAYDVPVLACNGNLNISPWGELLSTRAAYLGAAGCITDGCVRDIKVIRKMGFPVFSNSPERGIGWVYFTGPTMGYLIGFLTACYLSSFIKKKDNYLMVFIKLFLSVSSIYILGILWLGSLLGWDKPIIQLGVTPFLLAEITKIALLTALTKKIIKIRKFI